MKSQAGEKKSVGPGLPANRLATPWLGGRNFLFCYKDSSLPGVESV